MADFVFNEALGQIKTLCNLPATNDALVVVLIEATGLEADEALRDHNTLALLLAGTSNEQTNQTRKSITSSITVTVTDADNDLDIDVPDQVYTNLAGNGIGAVLFVYDGDTTGGDDTNITPLSKHGATITPDGSTVTVQIAAAGLMRAAG